MASKLRPKKRAAAEVRRLFSEELAQAAKLLSTADFAVDAAVHEVRKRIKRQRALLLLVRRALGPSFERFDRALGAVARRLAVVRDVAARLETLERLALSRNMNDREALFASARESFQQSPLEHEKLRDLLARAARRLMRLRRAFKQTRFRGDGFELFESGFRRTYRTARRRLRKALERPSVRALHELRKAVKAHQYQLYFLEPAWPELLRVRRESLSLLSELLGEHHDLSLIAPELRARGYPELQALAERRAAALEAEIFARAARLFAERPRHFAGALGAYYEIARSAPPLTGEAEACPSSTRGDS